MRWRGRLFCVASQYDTLCLMTDYDVAVFKFQSVCRVAVVLGVAEDFLGMDELLDRIQKRDSQAGILLEQFFNAYDQWFPLSKLDALGGEQFTELMQKMEVRDTTRNHLIQYLAGLQRQR